MKFVSLTRFCLKKIYLSLALVVFLQANVSTTYALDLSGLSGTLSNVSTSVRSVGAAVQVGTSIISDISSIFGGGRVGRYNEVSPAAGVPNVPNGNILPGPGNASFGVSYVRDVFLPNVTNWLVSVILAGSVVVIIAGGIMYIVSNGNQESSGKARETITWGIIGAVVAMIAYAIVRIVITINFLG